MYMIIHPHIVEAFERDSLAAETLSLKKKYAILEEMYTHAHLFGKLKNSTSLDDIKNDIEIARILHLDVQKTSY